MKLIITIFLCYGSSVLIFLRLRLFCDEIKTKYDAAQAETIELLVGLALGVIIISIAMLAHYLLIKKRKPNHKH